MTATTLALWLALASITLDQHQHPPASGTPQPKADATMCVQAQPAVTRTLEAANARLEAARQSNSAVDMRAAVDDMQAVLRDLRRQLEPCAALQPQPAGDPHAGHTMPQVAPLPPGKTAAAEAIDPVCGMKVDPATAPKAAHQGHTYYFCSEQDKSAFVKEPGKYIKK